MNAEYRARVASALKETEGLLARAMRYREDLRDADLIDFYNRHIVYLKKLLKD